MIFKVLPTQTILWFHELLWNYPQTQKYVPKNGNWRQSHNCNVIPNCISAYTVCRCKTIMMFLQGRKITRKLRDRCAICCCKIPDGEFSNPLIKGREFIFFSTYSFMRKTLLFSKQVTNPSYSRMKSFSQCFFAFLQPTSLPNDGIFFFLLNPICIFFSLHLTLL